MRWLIPLAAVLALVACGSSRKTDANVALLNGIPAYPNAAAPRTTTSGIGNSAFGARDWTLPANAKASAVIAWYAEKLRARGWAIQDRNESSIRGIRRGASLTVGVRGRTLEAVANSRGG